MNSKKVRSKGFFSLIKNMKTIWFVNPYGLIEGENWRDYSFNQFGKFLSTKGYKVIWWTANYSHHFKEYRSKGWHDIAVNENFVIRLVPTNSYKSNFSFKRLKKDFIFARNCYKRFKSEENPDLLITADNPMSFSYPSFKYCKENKVPIIYDQMDLWPEFFVKNSPWVLRGLMNFLLLPVYINRRKNYNSLTGVMALGKNYLEKAIEIGPKLKDRPSELVYNGIDISDFQSSMEQQLPDELSYLTKGNGEIWCVFAGTLGPSYDVLTIIECAKLFNNSNKNIKFIIAGGGPFAHEVEEAVNVLDNLIYLGKLKPDVLIPIYSKCDIGLSTYKKSSNVDMPDKFYDYSAAGLAIINSLMGEVKDYIDEYKLGKNYEAGNPISLKEQIEFVCESGNLLKFKANSKETSKLFDKDVQNDKLLSLIKRICI